MPVRKTDIKKNMFKFQNNLKKYPVASLSVGRLMMPVPLTERTGIS